MNADQARDAMNKVVLDAWIAAGYDAGNLRWTDVAGDIPADDIVWARCTIKHADGNQTALNGGNSDSARFTNTGTYFVQCFAPVGGGGVDIYDVAAAMQKAFQKSRGIDVWFRNARLKEVGTSGAFEQTNVLADFTYDN